MSSSDGSQESSTVAEDQTEDHAETRIEEADAPDGAILPDADDANADDEALTLSDVVVTDAAIASASPADGVDLAGLEALLFSTHHPLTAGRLAELLSLPTTKPIRKAIQSLNDDYASTGRSFRIEQVAGGYQMLTLPELGDLIKKLVQKEADAKLTKAAMETLAIVAYKQPILRVDVEGIRGVACGEAIRGLMEKHLVKIAGRAEEPGRPILYGTTKRFLEVFGLNSLDDLPSPEQGLKPAAPLASSETADNA